MWGKLLLPKGEITPPKREITASPKGNLSLASRRAPPRLSESATSPLGEVGLNPPGEPATPIRSQPVKQARGVFRPAPEAPKRKINPLGVSGLYLASVPFLRLYARSVFGY